MNPPYTIGPRAGADHTHTVILLHGRDSDACEFADELFESEASTTLVPDEPRNLPNIFPTVRWVFPSSGALESARFGTLMNQWFDIWSVENPEERSELQAPGLRDSVGHIEHVLDREERLVPREGIILGGISQGFATAITYFLTGHHKLAGLVGFSSWLPFASESQDGEDLPLVLRRHIGPEGCSSQGLVAASKIFLAHCEDDSIVSMKEGERLRDSLISSGLEVTWYSYKDGGHWVNEPQGIDDLVTFLRGIMLEA